MKHAKAAVAVFFITLIFISFSPTRAHANFFTDVVDKVKSIFVKEDKPQQTDLSIDSQIVLAPGGDVNNNGQIDSGDIVRFIYSVKNSSDKTYAFSTIKTNINRNSLNFIHNIIGVSGLADNAREITLPNIRLYPHQDRLISFDARVNYFEDEDHQIETTAVLETADKSVIKAAKKEITAKKLKKGTINSLFDRKNSNE